MNNDPSSLQNFAKGLFQLSFQAMGTACQISFSADNSKQAEEFKKESLSWVRNFEKRYSRYLPDSLISKINQSAGTQNPVSIKPSDLKLFKLCDTLHFFTVGLFDPTTLPLSNIWNFKTEKPQIPNAQKIEFALSKIGWKKVIIEDSQVYLPEKGMGLDFGGFGKEFAVDQVVEIATKSKIENLLVNFGGDVRTLGSPPDRDHWIIGVENPKEPGCARFNILSNNLAVATSGNYLRFFEHNGHRYGHLLDHRTGYPSSSKNLSSTVIANSCLEAGILSTCSLLENQQEGLSMIDRYYTAEGCVWSKTGIAWTKKFDTYLQYNKN
jgi:thiamine biosynthesis lipoprotein